MDKQFAYRERKANPLLIWILLAGLKCIVDENSLQNKINNQI